MIKEQLYKGRDPQDEVLKHVIEDFKFAIRWLPEKSLSESGRLNKEAARTQLARIYLHFGTYKKYHNQTGTGDLAANMLLKEAVAQTDTLMDSGKFDIVKGTDTGCDQLPYANYPLYYQTNSPKKTFQPTKNVFLLVSMKQVFLTHEIR